MKEFLLIIMLILVSCSTPPEDQSGVTSTGNSGEISGEVFHTKLQSSNTQLSKTVAYGAKVYLYNSSMKLIDSIYTHRDGGFLFRNVPNGKYTVKSIVEGVEISLGNIYSGSQCVVQMTYGETENKGSCVNDFEESVGLYSADSGLVEQSIWLELKIEDSSYYDYWYGDTFTIEKWYAGRSYMEEKLYERWSFNLNGLGMMVIGMAGASESIGEFFSTLPDRVNYNNWYYNGDLRYDVLNSPDYGTSNALPEIRDFAMKGLLLEIDSLTIRARFASDKWCFTSHANTSKLISSHGIFGTMDPLNCNSYQLIYNSGDTSKVKVLWYEPGSLRVSEEISRNGERCVYTGYLSGLSSSECFSSSN